MKIYTRTGDRGETGLLGGVRVPKSHAAIEVCGELDETNCALGVARAMGLDSEIDPMLAAVQHDLFAIGANLAAVESAKGRNSNLPAESVARLEAQIDQIDLSLVELKAFILPGGSPGGAMLHLARAICRRAERRLVELRRLLPAGERFGSELVYLNRLSDLLFVMARLENQRCNQSEQQWHPER